ncbi:MAG: hypothetical protein AABZ45_06945, partial [Pseudomonadota bacterium]
AEPGRFDGDGDVAVAASEGVTPVGTVDPNKLPEQPLRLPLRRGHRARPQLRHAPLLRGHHHRLRGQAHRQPLRQQHRQAAALSSWEPLPARRRRRMHGTA